MQQANRNAELENFLDMTTREIKVLKRKVSIEGYVEQLEPLIRKFFSQRQEEHISKVNRQELDWVY
jgi:hypothetical protein